MPEAEEALRAGLREQIRALIRRQGPEGARLAIAGLLTTELRAAERDQSVILHTRDIDGQRYVRLEDAMEAIAQAASPPSQPEEDPSSLGIPATCGGCGQKIWKISSDWHAIAPDGDSALRCPGDGDKEGHHWPARGEADAICCGCGWPIALIQGRWVSFEQLAQPEALRCPSGGALHRGGAHHPPISAQRDVEDPRR